MTPQQRASLGANIIIGNLPGSMITSGYRSAYNNKRVGGVSNSDHLRGNAIDFKPPNGISNKDAINILAKSGADIRTMIDENDHVHVSFNDTFANVENRGRALIEQGKTILNDIGAWTKDPIGQTINAAGNAVTEPFEQWFKRIGIGLLGFVMIAAVIFYMTKTSN